MLDPSELIGCDTPLNTIRRTFTVNDTVPVFPAASDAEQLTRVLPTGNIDPEEKVHVGPLVTSTLSVAVTANVTTAPSALVVRASTFDGALRTGGLVSARRENVIN